MQLFTQAVLPALVAFALQMVLMPLLIPALKRLKFGQYIREEGPKEHLKKAGTPTMGGIAILISFLVATLVCLKNYSEFWIVPAMTIAFGIIGFLDDYLKIALKHNEGLKAWQKFGLQIVVAVLFAVYLARTGYGTEITLYITGKTVDLGWFFHVLVVLEVVAVVNGTNFNDGLDGLSSSVASAICMFLMIASYALGRSEVSVASALFGALLGFLMFNWYPAKVFMGDTGSLALGGFVSAMAFVLRMPLLLLIFGFVYVAEVVSVMLQVAYFKATHGKRLFRMAPIHHHFELGGWHETKVVAVFTVVTILLSMVSLCLRLG